MGDLERTLRAVAAKGWPVVLLQGRQKRPLPGRRWQITTDLDAIRCHLEEGGNLGLQCGPASGVAVCDFDDPQAAREMMADLGKLRPWVRTGSGKGHCYLRWEPRLPAKIRWRNRLIGELQRGPVEAHGQNLQQAVIPPSLHPETHRPYAWLVDPSMEPLALMPERWRACILAPTTRPAAMVGGARHRFDGTTREMLARAAALPGGRTRSYGIKFRCPCCAADGHDKSCDNAVAMNDGRFGCAYAPGDNPEGKRHRRAIAIALGIAPKPWWGR